MPGPILAPVSQQQQQPLASLWATVSQVRIDEVAYAQGAAGALLGLLGLRFVPMLFLVVGWEAAEYTLLTWGPPVVVDAIRGVLRPALSDVAATFAPWIVGRLVHGFIQRRRRAALFSGFDLRVEDDPTKVVSSYDVIGEEPASLSYRSYARQSASGSYGRQTPVASASYPRNYAGGASASASYSRRPSYARVPTSLLNAERWPDNARIPYDLDDAEAEVVRTALARRLAELRQGTRSDRRGGHRTDAWQTIAVLESLLARLPPSTKASQWDAA
jgi:hypothetical protein